MKTISATILMLAFALLANAQIVPFFDVKSGGLLGGSENGKFVDAKTTFDKISGVKDFTVFRPGRKTTRLAASIEAPSDPCDDFYYVQYKEKQPGGVGIGDARTWNPLPREVEMRYNDDSVYRRFVREVLDKNGLKKAKVKIEQLFRVDLDGDGRDEVILTASSYGGIVSTNAKANDYSFVLLRKIVDGKVKSIIIAEEYIKNNTDFGAPSRYEIASLIDLNGDGKMEIVMFGEYYEGSGASVYEVTNDGISEVKILEAGCGV